MNREEKLLEIVNEVVGERLSQLIEEMSTDEFVEMIGDMYFDQTGNNLDDGTDDEFNQDEYLNGIIGSRVVPLLLKVCEWSIGKNIPTK
jgi:Mg/Co/Ni transporter MgtE